MGDKDLSDLTNNVQLVRAYKTYILKAAQLLCDQDQGHDPLHHDGCNTSIINSNIEEIIQLESLLANIRLPIEDLRDPEHTYNKLTLDELHIKTQFDWLNKIFLPIWKMLNVTVSIDGRTKVIVSDINYLVKAVSILSKTTPRVIENYFGWHVVDQYGSVASELFRNLVFEFNKIRLGVAKPTERWQNCLNLANDNLPWAISRLYVDNYFTKQEKQAAASLIDEVQQAFIRLIKENSWLDPVTKKASINKLKHVTKNVAYPDWLLDNSELDRYHGLENKTFVKELLEENNYALSLIRFIANYVQKVYNGLDKPIDIDKKYCKIDRRAN